MPIDVYKYCKNLKRNIFNSQTDIYSNVNRLNKSVNADFKRSLGCKCGKECKCNICCYCSDTRGKNYYVDIYLDNIGLLLLNNVKFNIPRNLYYCCVNQELRNRFLGNLRIAFSRESRETIRKYKKIEPLTKPLTLQNLSYLQCEKIYDKTDLINLCNSINYKIVKM